MTDLDPDVRDRAARAARKAFWAGDEEWSSRVHVGHAHWSAVHEYSTNADVVERVRGELAWAIESRRRYVEIRPEDARELINKYDLLTAALTAVSKLCDRADAGTAYNNERFPDRLLDLSLSTAEVRAVLAGAAPTPESED